MSGASEPPAGRGAPLPSPAAMALSPKRRQNREERGPPSPGAAAARGAGARAYCAYLEANLRKQRRGSWPSVAEQSAGQGGGRSPPRVPRGMPLSPKPRNTSPPSPPVPAPGCCAWQARPRVPDELKLPPRAYTGPGDGAPAAAPPSGGGGGGEASPSPLPTIAEEGGARHSPRKPERTRASLTGRPAPVSSGPPPPP